MESRRVTRLDLHDKIMEKKDESVEFRKRHILEYLIAKFNLNEDEAAKNILKKNFFHRHLLKWNQSFRRDNIFRKKYEKWLKSDILLPSTVYKNLPSTSNIGSPEEFPRGRPSKHFEGSSQRSKRRKTEELRATTSAAELSFAASMKHRDIGDEDVAKLIKEVTTTTPTRAKRVLSKWRKWDKEQSEMSPEDNFICNFY
ncbi:hypothetical protein J437_LFUL012365 [Ladona fulva]|uniref:Uncharacterized protein n=1 Tax=Ladona fulva TaxID=123851 RepID=A0A8K0KCB2_LADFU|nr:hypothetical protein J437_LFUL012365 [Ladona fulva]